MMNSILTALLIAILLPSLVQTASDQSSLNALEEDVRRMEDERREAILRNDLKALDRLLAPELTTITSQNLGKVTTKKEELAVNASDTRKIQSWIPKDVIVRVYGNVGLVTGLAEVVDVLRGESRRIVFQSSHVWVKRDGHWQLLHRHLNRVSTMQGR